MDPLAELLAPLTPHEALVESTRCLYCYDAPCTHACPTHIDIPSFIKKISTGNLRGSALTILNSNLLGATCARVCPVQELCEGACVLGSEHKPIAIGRLQRYAMDSIGGYSWPLEPAPTTGNSIGVVGAGPAGLSCAGCLALLGHEVTIYEKNELPGGLSTYGIIALREPVEIALGEVEQLKRLGVQVQTNLELGRNLDLAELRAKHSAVFLSVGLGSTPQLGIPHEELIVDGLKYIADSKINRAALPNGNQVLVIGAGNTAIDCATIAKRMGAQHVTILYRRTEAEMTAYPHEVEFARREGIEFRFLTQPVGANAVDGKLASLRCTKMELAEPDSSGRRASRAVGGSEHDIPTDLVIKAIGQEKPALAEQYGLATDRGYLAVNADFETSMEGVFAGGDCVRAKGDASTVMAVQDGKMAADAIHKKLSLVRK